MRTIKVKHLGNQKQWKLGLCRAAGIGGGGQETFKRPQVQEGETQTPEGAAET